MYTGLERTIYNFFFFRNRKNNLLSLGMENTLNGEKSIKIKHISVNTHF